MKNGKQSYELMNGRKVLVINLEWLEYLQCSFKTYLFQLQGYLLINIHSSFEYLLFSGMLKFPLCIAKVLSPNGKVKKHSLYNKQPNAWNRKNLYQSTLQLQRYIYLLRKIWYLFNNVHALTLKWHIICLKEIPNKHICRYLGIIFKCLGVQMMPRHHAGPDVVGIKQVRFYRRMLL